MWLTVILVCYSFKEVLLFIILKQSVRLNEPFYFIFTDASEIFYAYFVTIFFFANQFLIIYFFYHLFIFLSFGLFSLEYFYLKCILKISFFLLIFSIIMYNEVFFPMCWNFFLSFQNCENIVMTFYFECKLSEFLFFYIYYYYYCVLYFQFLILLFLLFQYQEKLSTKFRKLFYYLFLIFSTLITPPDILSQLFVSFCLVFSYEVLVFYFICKKVS